MCDCCGDWYHDECLNANSEDFAGEQYKCDLCRKSGKTSLIYQPKTTFGIIICSCLKINALIFLPR